jgi:probable rRNA maturation factor
MSSITIDISNQQTILSPPVERLREAIVHVLAEEGIASAEISVAIVDDPAIHRINRDFLGHDYPTDVISFVLDQSGGSDESPIMDSGEHLEGELVVSAETAVREAPSHEWESEDELLLYIVHGLLHLCGYDDLTDESRPLMRRRERQVLAHWQLVPTGLEA